MLHVVLAPIIFVLGSLAVRINLEFIMAVFRIAESTAALREAPEPPQSTRDDDDVLRAYV